MNLFKKRFSYIINIIILILLTLTISNCQIEKDGLSRIGVFTKKQNNNKKELYEILHPTHITYDNKDSLYFQFLQNIKSKIFCAKYYNVLSQCAQLYCYLGKTPEYSDNEEKVINTVFQKVNTKLSKSLKIKLALLNLSSGNNKNNEVFSLSTDLLKGEQAIAQRSKILCLRGGGFQELTKCKSGLNDLIQLMQSHMPLNNPEKIVSAYNGLTTIKSKMSDTSSMLEYFKITIPYVEYIEDPKKKIDLYSNKGVGFKITDSLEQGIRYYQKALAQAVQYNVKQTINMENINSPKKDFAKSLECLEISLAICKERNIDYATMLNYYNTGYNFNIIEEYPSAKIYLNSALIYAKKLKLAEEEAALYSEYYKYYKGIGSYQTALEYYEKFYSLKEDIINESAKRSINELQIKYETAVKDKEIENISAKLEEKKAHNRLLAIFIIIIVIPGFFLLFFLMYRNKKIRDLYKINVKSLEKFNEKEVSSIVSASIESMEDTIFVEEDVLKRIFNIITELLEKEKVFKDALLSVSEMAELVGYNEKYISQSISKYGKENFSNHINVYRVNEAKRLIFKKEYNTLNEVKIASGFNSRTTFYNAFYRHTGMSPKQFKDLSTRDID